MADLENLSVEELRSMLSSIESSPAPAVAQTTPLQTLTETLPSNWNWRGGAEIATGGLLNFGSGLTLGAMPKIVAGGTALIDALLGQQSVSDAYTNRLAQVRALEQEYKQAAAPASVAGIPLTEIGGSLLMPLPGLKAAGSVATTAKPVIEAATSIAKQAGLGAGLSGTQSLISSDKPIEERIQDAASSAGVGALFGGVLGSGVEAVKAIPSLAKALTEYGKGLQRTSIGTRYGDYAKSRIISTSEPVAVAAETQTKKAINNVIDSNVLGSSRNPYTMYDRLLTAKKAVDDKISAVISAFDAKGKKIPPPSFNEALDYVAKNVPADKVNKYINQIERLSDAIKREGGGTLEYLNSQRKAMSEKWKDVNQSDPGFWRAMYMDMKKTIESHAPEVQALNKEKQSLLLTEPVLARNVATKEASANLTNAQKALYTTGGWSLPTLALLSGSPTTGMMLSAALKAATLKYPQSQIGKLATKIGQAGEGVTGAGIQSLANALQRMTPSLTAQEPTQQSFPSSIQVEQPNNFDSMSLEQLQGMLNELEPTAAASTEDLPANPVKADYESLIEKTALKYGVPPEFAKAVALSESAYNPKAKSKKGATGLFQLMPGTAKDLGVDPIDPVQNIDGGIRYLAEQLKQFNNDKKLAAAAYNWGPARVSSAIAKANKQGISPTWNNIMDLVWTPGETQKYVRTVLNKTNQYRA